MDDDQPCMSGLRSRDSRHTGHIVPKRISGVRNLPSTFIENTRQHTCSSGCQPRLDLWDKQGRAEVMGGIVEDETNYCGTSETKSPLTDFFDRMFKDVSARCKSHFGDLHLCDKSEKLKPFMDCVNQHSLYSAARSFAPLWPIISEEKCKKASVYFASPVLSKEHFPKHIEKYRAVCHEGL
ncbi:hypothetical protein N7532_009705 [Penicillium argentinense]|uniref:Uncharacterized protein n=1 Tax=Penicillium argentinense TaxID=1131581 RepID=A0A9W9K379_9EURO|nr:uncharacterized protein N7532_009705 [Penicillium argentinense]KAJ5091021.1 hypothetical protein N7532_009705 [Penicillium argentinense]